MKIRTDFVTNSSSSSFVAFNIKNKELAEICMMFSLPIQVKGDTISNGWAYWQPDQSEPIVGTPRGGSVADWFEDLVDPKKNQVIQLWNFKVPDGLYDYIRENKDKINASTEYLRVDSGTIVTDDYGSGVTIEIREKGVIKTIGIDEGDWATEEMGEPLWSVLQDVHNSGLIEYAEDNGLVSERKDPWYVELSENEIFDNVDSIDLNGKGVCLTGDFAYGSKKKVEEYISGLGGKVCSSVTKEVKVVIVGALGSKAWSHNNYGSKVEKAIELRKKGNDILIIQEKDLFKNDSDITEKISAIKEKRTDSEKDKAIALILKKGSSFFRQAKIHRDYDYKCGKSWISMYKDVLSRPDFIDFAGKSIVLSGCYEVFPKGTLEALGALVKEKVSSKTDYLFVEPAYSGHSKIHKIIDLKKAGGKAQVILASDVYSMLKNGKYNTGKPYNKEDAEREKEEAKLRAEQMKLLEKKEKLNDIIDELHRRYGDNSILPHSFSYLRRKNSDIPNISDLGKYIRDIISSDPEIYLKEQGLIEDSSASNKKKLLGRLEAMYPDKKIDVIYKSERDLAEELAGVEGYPSYAEFLEANGYTLDLKKSAEEMVTYVLDLLRERYPEGAEFITLNELKEANSDIADQIATANNKASSVLGMSLRDYLLQQGIMKEEEKTYEFSDAKLAYKDEKKARLFAKLDEAYPDKVISQLYKNHKKWGETALDIARMEGYGSYREMLEANGYTVKDGESGPKKTDYFGIIDELKNRYPNGSEFTSVADLKVANPDIGKKFKVIQNKQHELFGMTFTKYLISIGILKEK